MTFVLALLVRAAWLCAWQQPGDAIFSDMAGYWARAQALLAGNDTEVCFPPGTHWFYAAELAVADPRAMGWVHAALGASLAPMAVLLARRVGSLPEAAALGTLVALWYPLVTFGGYFSSELPYAVTLMAGAWLWVRWQQTGRGAALAGVATGAAYLIRPPALLAFALVFAWELLRGTAPWRGRLAVLLPVLLAVGLGAARYHDRTGRWGLISDNGAVMSLFAWSDYAGLHAKPPPGLTPTQTGFHPPGRGDLLPDFEFTGLRCDAAPLLAERNRVIASSSLDVLVARATRNVTDLFGGNTLWPERTRAGEGLRRTLLDWWPVSLTWGFLPLAGLGLLWHLRTPTSSGRTSLALYLLAMVLTAVFYTGEVRYRVPYDPLLLLFSVHGVRPLRVAVAGLARAHVPFADGQRPAT